MLNGLGPMRCGGTWYHPRRAFPGAYTGELTFVVFAGGLYSNKTVDPAKRKIGPGIVYVRGGLEEGVIVVRVRGTDKVERWGLA